ncbi:MAG: glycosyl hydrolase 53 family protein [Bacilli bacterium]|nr:glycosyl hydrolase 53 family protein [Bacilli bacterium]MBO6284687.1 glycosyl hydrolase 53 family protein [Bacilli bacterium]
MRLGIDASTLDQLEKYDPHFYYEGKEIEPLSFLHEHNGIGLLRLRLWLDPYDEQGVPYGAGTNDFDCFLRLAKRGNAAGYKILLDFHYSDFWVDPAKQTMPKAWRGKTLEEVVDALYEYTRDTLLRVKAEGIELAGIQVGNEITHGMCWPLGKLNYDADNRKIAKFENLALLLKAGTKACKEVFPDVKTVIHLEHSCSVEMQEHWFRSIIDLGVEFDVIGESYYSYWHGSLEELAANLDNLHKKFGKELWIVELGYAYEPARRDDKEGLGNLIDERFRATHDLKFAPYPFTQQGQYDFLRHLIRVCAEHHVEQMYYWEPLWLPLPNCGWADLPGQAYINEHGDPQTDEWANETLFDSKGNATLGLDAYKL